MCFLLSPFHFNFASGGSSSVGRASAFQAECREFEPRLPLQKVFVENGVDAGSAFEFVLP